LIHDYVNIPDADDNRFYITGLGTSQTSIRTANKSRNQIEKAQQKRRPPSM
jgi:hypothetical protein